ncbi:hypothetical protein NEF87_004612 [Candidatus Lokiarchaeum ossiferum]|uniref:NADPH-dependent FMN reductase-like domain-containing protein n=1 Tax=Candidatus Lokiarchaeum ossiferum TaxID=2951803 RepID=A0ABY6HZM2_9ARCH|nr:hypothetical protein NEF87_004612 [Candidatus Lokiarchaeum sp. B-35]
MCNILVLHGSPRRGRNSDTLTEKFLDGIKSKVGVKIEHCILDRMNIAPCRGCFECTKVEPHLCIINDDMQQIYRSYRAADLIIYTTPMYWDYITAQMKLAIDRMEPLAWDGFSGKKVFAIFTYRNHYELADQFFKQITPFFKLDYQSYPCQTYDPKTQRDIPIEELPEKQEEIFTLGIKMGEKLQL